MQLWDVLAADATGRTDPRVLFSTPEARMVMIDLAAGEQLGEHEVHERAIIQVARGSIELTSGDAAMTCGEGVTILLAIACSSAPPMGLRYMPALRAVSMNCGSLKVSSKAWRNAATRSAGTPGAVRIGRPTVMSPDSTSRICRCSSVCPSSLQNGASRDRKSVV